MRLIITGASGFVGRQIIPILLARGVEILAVGRDSNSLAEQFPDVEVCDYKALETDGKGADAVLHLAVRNNHKGGGISLFRHANVELLEKVVLACKTAGVSHMIYLGSLHSANNTSNYGRSKNDAERLLQSADGLTVTLLRLPAVYGYNEFQGRLSILTRIPQFFRGFAFQILRSLKPTVHVNIVAESVFNSINKPENTDEILSDGQAGNMVYSGIKKFIDIAFALSVALLLWWLLISVWAIVKVTSVGPGIFAQHRVGRLDKVFTLYKFRTMAMGTKQAGTHEVSDASVTPVGHILRRLKIDELPQIVNILKGELSLVGPRPCLSSQTMLIAERNARGLGDIHRGITGYAQVRGVDMSDPQRLAELDETYMKLRCVSLDIRIILQTALGSGSGDRTSRRS